MKVIIVAPHPDFKFKYLIFINSTNDNSSSINKYNNTCKP